MPLIPPWAPNVHPLLIHFPIVLVLVAVLADVVHLARPRLALSGPATSLYVLAAASAVAAFLTGRAAEPLVFTPGMAHALVADHERWALATTVAFGLVAAVRVAGHVLRWSERRAWRVLCVALGAVSAILVQQTAERGARLVYEQGVGVIQGPAPARGRSN